MEQQVEKLVSGGNNKSIFIIGVIYVIYFFFTSLSPVNVLFPLEQFIHTTSRTLVFAQCYDIAQNVRMAVIEPFKWRLINHNNKIMFMLPTGSGGYRCPEGASATAVFSSYNQQTLHLECFSASSQAVTDIIRTLPYERVNIITDCKTKYSDITVLEVVNVLLRQGVFTLENMT